MSVILKKTVQHNVEIPLSGSEIAKLFWELSATEMANFFNQLGLEWELAMQLQYVSDNSELNQVGRLAMKKIGEYAESSI